MATSGTQHYLLSSGSLMETPNVQCASTFRRLNKEGDPESANCLVVGRPKDDGKRILRQHILTISPPSHKSSSPLHISRFCEPASISLSDLQCSLCQLVCHLCQESH